MQTVIKGIDILNTFLRYLTAILLAGMTILITFQVVIRFMSGYFDVHLPRWTEELARYAMVWLVFIGAALAVRYSALIGMEAIAERLKPSAKRVLKTAVLLISMILFIVMIVYGLEMITHVSAQLSPGAKIPMSIPYAAIPVGGFFMLLNSIAVMIETWHNNTKREFFEGSE